MKKLLMLAVFCVFAAPGAAMANAGDFSGAVAIGTSYASTITAPANGLIVQGNVGIGNSNPSSLLAVGSTPVGGTGAFTVVGSAGGTSGVFSDNTNSELYIKHPTSGFILFDSDNGNAIQWGNNGSVKMTLLPGGNLGIGTTSPANLLQVGSTTATGAVLKLQNSSGACTHTPGAASETVSCSSDASLKNNIHDADDVLPWLDSMRIRSYDIKATGEKATGVIAQEMLRDHATMVHKSSDGLYSVDAPSTWQLVKAIQELHQIIIEQRKEIDSLKTQIQKQP